MSPVWLFIAVGCAILFWFFKHIQRLERADRQPLLAPRMFANRTANLGLFTQMIQWLTLQGSFFVISVFLQTVRGYSAIETGLLLSPSTVGILCSSALAERIAKRRPQALVIRAGFSVTTIGTVSLLLFADADSSLMTFAPGLFLMGTGIGLMLTASVNVVQSSFPEHDQGEISGLSRSVSNLGSSLGTAFVGSVLASTAFQGNHHFGVALTMLVVIGGLGLIAAFFIPSRRPASASVADADASPTGN